MGDQGATTEDYSKMKVVELKKILKDRGLTVNGTKDELIERLRQANEANEKKLLEDTMEETEETTESTAASIDEELENEIMNESDKPVVGDKRKIESAPSQTTEENKENSAEADKQDEPSKKIIKISAITPEEKKELRAKKFGLTEDEKKEARAKRFGITAPSTTPSLGTTKPVTTVKRNPITSVNTKDSELLKKRAERFGIGQSPTIVKTKLTPEEEEKRKKRAERFGIPPPVTPPAVTTTDDKK